MSVLLAEIIDWSRKAQALAGHWTASQPRTKKVGQGKRALTIRHSSVSICAVCARFAWKRQVEFAQAIRQNVLFIRTHNMNIYLLALFKVLFHNVTATAE